MSAAKENKEPSIESLRERARKLALQWDCSQVVSVYSKDGYRVQIAHIVATASGEREALSVAIASAAFELRCAANRGRAAADSLAREIAGLVS